MAGQGIKEYDELLFTDDFLFCKVLENNEDLCKELLELILGKKIRRVNYLAKQKVIDITSDGKGVRLDSIWKMTKTRCLILRCKLPQAGTCQRGPCTTRG